jgi:predicted MFS family arabinose efflux permease
MDSRLLWLALGAFAGSVESALVVAVMPAVALETGVSISEAGLVVFVYSIAYGFGTPLLSTLFGGVDRRRVVAGAEFAFGCGCILFGLLPGFIAILMARTALAFGAGLFTSTAQSTAVALAQPGKRGKAVSTIGLGGTIAVAFGAPLAALVAQLYGWRIAYVGLGLIAVTAAAIMWWRLPHNLHGDPRTLRERVAVLGERGVPMTLLTSALVTLATFILMIYLAPIATTGVGLASTVMPMLLFAYGIGALVGNYTAGWTVDRLGARRTMVVFITALVLLMAALPLVAATPVAIREGAFLAYIVVFGGLTWGFFPAQLLRLAMLAPKSVSLAASLNLTAGNIGGALAALIGGFAFERFGTLGIGLGGASIAVLALIVSLLVPDPEHQASGS